MGPRSRDRGIASMQFLIAASLPASMGPRSRDRGIWQMRGRTVSHWSLQWGRDHVIAESPAWCGAIAPTRALQWGRDHVIAESRRHL